METFSVQTATRCSLIPVTAEVQKIVHRKQWQQGAIVIFCPHTTAALTINEAADPSVAHDITNFMATAVPRLAQFTHAEGNSDAHIKTALFGAHCMVIIENGTICLGQWQGIYLCDWDGPRTRNIWLQYLPATE